MQKTIKRKDDYLNKTKTAGQHTEDMAVIIPTNPTTQETTAVILRKE